MRIGVPNLPDHLRLSPHLLADLILIQRVEHLSEAHLWHVRGLLDFVEEVVQHVGVCLVATARQTWRLNDCGLLREHDHVVVCDAALNQFFGVDLQFVVLKEQSLVQDWDLRLDFEQALEVFDSDVTLYLHVVEHIFLREVLDE